MPSHKTNWKLIETEKWRKEEEGGGRRRKKEEGGGRSG